MIYFIFYIIQINGQSNEYKSFRFLNDPNRYSKWPWITDTNKWINSDTKVFNSGEGMGTYLKSFNNADEWTIDELKIWEKCLSEIGMIVCGKYPLKRDLKYKY